MPLADVPAPTQSDGRYYWTGNASGVTGDQITFVGDSTLLTGTCSLAWTITQRASDGSYPVLSYSTSASGTPVSSFQLGAEGTPQEVINESGQINVDLTGATGFTINITSGGGAPVTGAAQWQVALAIVRDPNAVVPWDLPNPFDPISYNAQYTDLPGQATLGALLQSMMYRLGFANQAANPPPGMTPLLTQFLQDSQTVLYHQYPALHTRRFFRWKLIPGVKFYSLKDNDENVLSNYHMDPRKTIEWAGIQDNRNVWYPLIEGIPPTLYTMITKPWRPARYEIRQAIEIYPVPDQTYWLWVKGHFGMLSFAASTDTTTIDSTLVYLHALANAKAHYGQPDANNVMGQAQALLADLTAATHGTRKYVPGTLAVPPAVRPTMIQFDTSST